MALPTGTGYAEATATNPSNSLTDFTLLVDLSKMPSEWWNAIDTSDKEKLRVADESGTELPRDVISFTDNGDGTGSGWVRVKYSGTLSSSGTQGLRIYPPQASMSSYASGDTFGQHNAYDANWEGYWPDGGGVDRTANGNDLTANGGVSFGGAAGQVGDATNYDGTDDYGNVVDATLNGLPASHDMTAFFWFQAEAVGHGTDSKAGLVWEGTDDLMIYPNDDLDGTGGTRVFWRDLGDVIISEAGSDLIGTGWHHQAFVSRGSSDHEAYRDASSVGTSAASGGAGPFDGVSVGAFDAGQFFDGLIDEVQIHSTARSDAWISEEYDQSNDQDSFWSLGGGTWTWVAAGSSIPVIQHHRRMMGAA